MHIGGGAGRGGGLDRRHGGEVWWEDYTGALSEHSQPPMQGEGMRQGPTRDGCGSFRLTKGGRAHIIRRLCCEMYGQAVVLPCRRGRPQFLIPGLGTPARTLLTSTSPGHVLIFGLQRALDTAATTTVLGQEGVS